MPRYSIRHLTSFHYSYPVAVSHHSAYLKPKDTDEQRCHRFELGINPQSLDVIERTDFFDNTTQIFSIQEQHAILEVESKSIVTVEREQLDLNTLEQTCRQIREQLNSKDYQEQEDELQFLYPTPITPDLSEVEAFGNQFIEDDMPIGTAISELLSAFNDQFEFDPTATHVNTPISESLEKKRGVCQDFAHLMIGALRANGLCAKYCSGYLLTHPPEGQARLTGADASHAWVAVYIPDFGWVQVDPTNNATCSDEYILVASGRDYSDITMLKGAVSGGGEHTVSVGVTVLPIDTA